MKIKLDENIPVRIASILNQLGHEADTVPQEGLAGKSDNQVWEAAQKAGAFFVTQDKWISRTSAASFPELTMGYCLCACEIPAGMHL